MEFDSIDIFSIIYYYNIIKYIYISFLYVSDDDFQIPKPKTKNLSSKLSISMKSHRENNSVSDLFDTSISDSVINNIPELTTSQFDLGHESLLAESLDNIGAAKPTTFSELMPDTSYYDDCLVFVRSKTVSNNQICSLLRYCHNS